MTHAESGPRDTDRGGKGCLTCRVEMKAGALVRLCRRSRATSSVQCSKTTLKSCSMLWLMAPSHCSCLKKASTDSAIHCTQNL